MFLKDMFLVLDATCMNTEIEQIVIDDGFTTTFVMIVTEHWLLLTTVGIIGVTTIKTQSVVV
jgi:hypothetical protein